MIVNHFYAPYFCNRLTVNMLRKTHKGAIFKHI